MKKKVIDSYNSIGGKERIHSYLRGDSHSVDEYFFEMQCDSLMAMVHQTFTCLSLDEHINPDSHGTCERPGRRGGKEGKK